MARKRAISSEEFDRTYGRKSRGLGGAVSDGDSRHKKHSHMVGKCGSWLNTQRGVLVWATYTGRPTGRGVCGTPGVADLCGWRHRSPHEGPVHCGPFAIFLAVECKVKPDKLNKAQEAFREESEAAGCMYFLAVWDGKDPEAAADDLKRQWQEQGGRADG